MMRPADAGRAAIATAVTNGYREAPACLRYNTDDG